MSDEIFDRIMTNEQCLKLIEKAINSNQFHLLNYSLKPLGGETKGYLATHLIGTFDIQCKEKIQTLKFFMKLKLDTEGGIAKLTNDENDVYIRESTFLKLVTNDYHVKWAPKFYDYIDNKLIVLEDLSERGFKITDSGEYDLNHCHVGLNTLASFHAFSLKYFHDKRSTNKEYSILTEYPYFFQEFLFTNETDIGRKFLKSTRDVFNFIIDEMQPKHVEKIKIKFNEKFDCLADELKPKENPYHVISHGDLWANNIMFSYENNVPKECCIVDYQQLRYILPTFDIQFFITVNTASSLREKHYDELLEYYYNQLSKELKKFGLDSNDIYPKEVFDKHCRQTIITAMMCACGYKAFLLMPRHKMTQYLTDPVISEEAMYGNRAKFIKEEMNINNFYKEKIFNEHHVLFEEIQKLL